jgi:hypothetical protein
VRQFEPSDDQLVRIEAIRQRIHGEERS